MARIRTFKPEILEDEKTAGLTDAGFRLFAAMILLSDDHGNVRADPWWLEGQVWWSRRFAATRGEPRRAAGALAELVGARLVGLYRVGDQLYAAIRSWAKHQRVDNAGNPRVPKPDHAQARGISDVHELFAGILGDSPRVAAEFREPPQNAARSPISDLRSPTSDPEVPRGERAVTVPRGTAVVDDPRLAEPVAAVRGLGFLDSIPEPPGEDATGGPESDDPEPPSAGARKSRSPRRAKEAEPEEPPCPEVLSALKIAIDGFHDRFVAARGTKPTWGGRVAKKLQRWFESTGHGPEEFLRRADVMFEMGKAGRWPADHGGDLDTLLAKFDHFAGGAQPRGFRPRGRSAIDIALEEATQEGDQDR